MSDTRVKVFGAGSIGNHLTYACRTKGWAVTMADIDEGALRRTKEDIYPARYGAWDDGIQLETLSGPLDGQGVDLAIIGTPPDTHMKIAMQLLAKNPPKVLLIEKPLATPDLAGCQELWDAVHAAGTICLVDYNHTQTPNTKFAETLVKEGKLGTPETLQVRWLEHWGGIFGAHPWLSGPADTYLGFSKRGGGAIGEHSHGINIWQHFAKQAGLGKVVEVSAMIDQVTEGGADYDRIGQISLRTAGGVRGFVVQDVVTEPPVKSLRFQGSQGFFEWHANLESGIDAVIHGTGSEFETLRLPKSRPDDFKGMIDQVEQLLSGALAPGDATSTLEDGLDTMMVIAAAFLSNQEQRTVGIDPAQGYRLDALTLK